MLEELPPLEKTAAKGRGKYMSADLDRPVFGGRIPTRWYLAIALQISSTITAMGAGMTVKFFPLFFKARRSPDRVHTSLLARPVAAASLRWTTASRPKPSASSPLLAPSQWQ